jgi:hypothetical protein
MKKLAVIVLVFLSLIGINQTKASHLMGGEITWTCVGQDSFMVKLIIYRDCNGITLGVTPINFKCAGIGTLITSSSIPVGTPVDITPICNSGCSRCQSTGCSFPYGIHRYTMQSIVDLSSAGSCCDVVLSWTQNARNAAITTIVGAGSVDLYIEAKMNRCLSPCDNSPSFINPPIAILCVGQDFTFNNGTRDIDVNANGGLTDSITYEWGQPLKSADSAVEYLGQYSFTKPIYFWGFPNEALPFPRGIHLDTTNGNISFRPMKAEVTIMVIKVKEFRNGVKIGEVRRDIQVIVTTCTSNNPPSITTPNNIRAKEVCPGQTVTFNFSTSDPNSTDTLSINWNNSVPGAQWTHNNGQSKHPTATLTWTPTSSHASSVPYTFTVTARDNACPVNSQYTVAYQITVIPNAKININPIDPACLNGQIISLNDYVTVNGMPSNKGIWSTPSAGLVYGDKFNPIAAGVSTPPGWKVKYEYTDSASGCYGIDSSYVTINAKPAKPVISLSPTDTFLECSLFNGAHDWFYRSDTFAVPNRVNNNSSRIDPGINCQNCYFCVIFTDSNGCVSDTSANFHYFKTSINNTNRLKGCKFYPNPAQSMLFVDFSGNETANLIITDILGNTILQSKIIHGRNDIDIQNYKPGIYFMFLNNINSGKLMIE